MDKKKIAVIIAAVILLAVVVVLCVSANKESNNNNLNENNNIVQNDNNNETNNNNGTNNSEQQKEPELPTTKIEGTKTLDTLVFSDIKIVEQRPGEDVLIATVKNNGAENIVDNVILNIELFTESGDSIGIIGGTLPFVAADSIAEMQVPIALDVMHTNNVTFSYANN